MKKLFGALLALFASVAFATTTVPIQLLSPMAANTVVANATGSSAGPTAFAMPGCSASGNALNWASGTGFTCATGQPGELLNVQVITSTQTYTPTAGTNSVIVEAVGAGGGSGGNAATSSGQNAASGGGGSGAYVSARFTSGFSGVTATIGAAGAAGAAGNNAGGTGGTTSFGGLISCPGGVGGSGGAVATSIAAGGAGGAGGAACTVSGGTTLVSVPGQIGGQGMIFVINAFLIGGGGGSTPIGIGALLYTTSTPVASSGYGAGALGVISVNSTAAAPGAIARPGIIIVYEYR